MSKINLAATGDICLKTPGDENPFEEIEGVLEKKDILFGNLEVVLAEKGAKIGKEKAVSLYEPPSKVKYLKEAGYDILNISNNHTADLGKPGLKSTKRTLEEESIPYIYDDGKKDTNYEVINKKGVSIGFLGYPDPLSTISISDLSKCFSINKIDKMSVIEDINNLKKSCDIVVVSIHWGIENVFYPSPNQIKMAHDFVDSGADIILGHHPHVVQGVEEYNDSIIAYSLGNFQFYPTSEISDRSCILTVDISSHGISGYDTLPIKIDEKFKPYVPQGTEFDRINEIIDILSGDIQKKKVTEEKWYEHIADRYLKYNFNSYISRIKSNPVKALPEAIIWSLTPFCMKCYIGLVRQYRNTDNEKQTKIGL